MVFPNRKVNKSVRHEVPLAPPLGELLSEREAEGVRYEKTVYATIYGRHPLSQPIRAASSPRGGAGGASHHGETAMLWIYDLGLI